MVALWYRGAGGQPLVWCSLCSWQFVLHGDSHRSLAPPRKAKAQQSKNSYDQLKLPSTWQYVMQASVGLNCSQR